VGSFLARSTLFHGPHSPAAKATARSQFATYGLSSPHILNSQGTQAMLPMIPGDALVGLFEMACYGVTVVATLVSWMFAMR
jgi:hypothetical protein